MDRSQGSKPRSGGGAFANPLFAEVTRLAKQKQQEEEAQKKAAELEAAQTQKKTRPSWRDDEDDEDDDQPSEKRGKRKHSPIVWAAQPKKAPRTAAELMQAELAEFAKARAAAGGDDGQDEDRRLKSPIDKYMKDSPEMSSPEEEMHRRRENTSAHDLHAAKLPLHSDDDDINSQDAGPALPVPPPADDDGNGYPEAWYPEVEAYPEVEDLDDDEYIAEHRQHDDGGDEQEDQQQRDDQDEEEEPTIFQRPVSMLNEVRSVDMYEKLNRISEGTYGVVYRARDRETGQICALKMVKLDKERDGFPLTSVREINILLSLRHPNIVNVSEVVAGSSLDSVFMVMEYADHDLKSVMEKRMKQPFTIAEVKCLLRQLLSGVAYLHENWVIHRDLKTSNILYTNRGQLKLCDFGLARQYGSPLKPYTHMVVTLWYRAPELLLGGRKYSTPVDVWSIGCIMAELLTKKPLFMGKNEMQQINIIFQKLGVPNSETWPGIENLPEFQKFNFKGSRQSVLRKDFPPPGPIFDGRPTLSEAGFNLLSGMLTLCPEKRLTAKEALDHEWFYEHPLPKDQTLMPTFPACNETLHGHGR